VAGFVRERATEVLAMESGKAEGGRSLEAEALLGRRIQGTAHELATPLSTITLRAELLLGRLAKQGTPEAEKDARAVRSILEAATRCTQVLSALRAHARVTEPVPERLELRSLVAEAFELLASPARHRNVTLEVAGELGHCRAPRGPLSQAVLGLLAHAVAVAAPGALTVEPDAADGALVFRFAGESADDRELAAARDAAAQLGVELRVAVADGATVLRLALPRAPADAPA
jgi:signal transduction histidine kinase